MEEIGEIKVETMEDIRIKEDMELQEVIIKEDIIIEVEITKEITIKIEEEIFKIINGVIKEDKILGEDPKPGIIMNMIIMIMIMINTIIRVMGITRREVAINHKLKNIDQISDLELHLDFKVQMLQLLDKNPSKATRILSFTSVILRTQQMSKI
jgi:hypothetical protein